jgi:drug/metabolite transporter (DMT)-like permease
MNPLGLASARLRIGQTAQGNSLERFSAIASLLNALECTADKSQRLSTIHRAIEHGQHLRYDAAMPGTLGELAALGTALCWTASATFFTFSARRVGSVTVNRLRLLVAAVLLILLHWALQGRPLPLEAEPYRWLWLGLSGVVGLTLGDAFLFQAYVWIGTRRTMLMMSLAPVISAFLAWATLGEALSLQQWLGIALTVSGIAWVVADRNGANGTSSNRDHVRGVLFGLGAALGQAVGLVLAKRGLAGDFPALSGNVIRMVSAAGAMWAFTLLRRQAALTFTRIRENPQGMLPILGGSVFGPVLGVWLSLISIQLTRVGVASTIMALPPVFLLPIAYFTFHEKIGWRALGGTLLAMIGVALLFLA